MESTPSLGNAPTGLGGSTGRAQSPASSTDAPASLLLRRITQGVPTRLFAGDRCRFAPEPIPIDVFVPSPGVNCVLIYGVVAVIIDPVAPLFCARRNRGVSVIAIARATRPSNGSATPELAHVRIAEAVPVGVGVEQLRPESVFICGPVAVVIDPVAQLGGRSSDGRVAVIAVGPTHDPVSILVLVDLDLARRSRQTEQGCHPPTRETAWRSAHRPPFSGTIPGRRIPTAAPLPQHPSVLGVFWLGGLVWR